MSELQRYKAQGGFYPIADAIPDNGDALVLNADAMAYAERLADLHAKAVVKPILDACAAAKSAHLDLRRKMVELVAEWKRRVEIVEESAVAEIELNAAIVDLEELL